MSEPNQGPMVRIGMLCVCALSVAAIGSRPAAARQAADQPAALQPGTTATATATSNSQESLTVLGRRRKFEVAPMPGPALGPPPDKPAPHLGRYKISGDQTTPDGHDTQTGAAIGQFGTAYTGASPVAGGLASRYEH